MDRILLGFLVFVVFIVYVFYSMIGLFNLSSDISYEVRELCVKAGYSDYSFSKGYSGYCYGVVEGSLTSRDFSCDVDGLIFISKFGGCTFNTTEKRK